MSKRLRPRERDAIIQSLKAGVTPRTGAQHIQVGRVNEVNALVKDIDRIVDGGAAFRLVIGDYGAGKTFFLSLIRSIALEKKLVTVQADLSPDRRIHASGGQARALFSELMTNMSTRTKADGNGLPSVVEKFVSSARQEAGQAVPDPGQHVHCAQRVERRFLQRVVYHLGGGQPGRAHQCVGTPPAAHVFAALL